MQSALPSDGPFVPRTGLGPDTDPSESGGGPGPRRLVRPALLFLLLILILYADPLFLRRNFGGRDLLGYGLPIEKAIHDAYSRGRIPLWLADVSGGRPLLANPNSGALYPVRPLLAVFPFPVAMRLFPILHWALGGIGMMLLASSIGLGAPACWIASVTYAFSGVSISEVFFTDYHPGWALLPWFLWALHRPARWGARAISTGVLLGLFFLAGDVFVGSLALLCGLLWIALETPTDSQKSSLAAFGAGVLLGALLAAPQIVATALWIPVTNRAILGMRLREALLYSVSPFRLLEFLIPFPFGPTWDLGAPNWGRGVFQDKTVGFFSTFYAGGFAILAVAVTRRSQARGARFARILLFLALGLSVLPSLVPRELGNVHSPLPLRYPEKLAVGVLVALALLAGIALESIIRDGGRIRWPLAVGALLTLAAVAARTFPTAVGHLAAAAVGTPGLADQAARDLAPSVAEGGLLWMATVIAVDGLFRHGRAGAASALVLLTAIPLTANRRIAVSFPQEQIFMPSELDHFLARSDRARRYRTIAESGYRSASLLQRDNAGADAWHLYDARNWDLYHHVLYRRGTVFNIDFDHGDLSRLESLRGLSYVASTFLDSGPFFGSLSLRWGIRYRDQLPLGGYGPIRSVGLQVWDENPQAQPAVRLLQRWVEVPDVLKAANIVPRLAPREVVLETEAERRVAARPGRLRILEDSPERLRLDAEAPDPTWLFVLRGFWAYRDVRVDGRPVETVPAMIAFTAVPIPSGSHHVEWKETFPGLKLSIGGPLLFLALAAVLARPRGFSR